MFSAAAGIAAEGADRGRVVVRIESSRLRLSGEFSVEVRGAAVEMVPHAVIVASDGNE